MYRVIVMSVLVTLAVILLSQLISYSSHLAAGREFKLFMFVMNIFLPAVTVLPASMLIFWKLHRLSSAPEALAKAHEECAITAAHDGVTGLLDRETFLSLVSKYKDRPGALLAVDVDNFKSFNNFGHAEGDAALRLIATALRCNIRGNDLLGRLGGEEFGVYLPEADTQAAISIAERLREEVARIRFYPAYGEPRTLSVSIGLAFSGAGFDLHHVSLEANANLHAAKAVGRNTVVWSTLKPRLLVVRSCPSPGF